MKSFPTKRHSGLSRWFQRFCTTRKSERFRRAEALEPPGQARVAGALSDTSIKNLTIHKQLLSGTFLSLFPEP
jgi:hypothetical protein